MVFRDELLALVAAAACSIWWCRGQAAQRGSCSAREEEAEIEAFAQEQLRLSGGMGSLCTPWLVNVMHKSSLNLSESTRILGNKTVECLLCSAEARPALKLGKSIGFSWCP